MAENLCTLNIAVSAFYIVPYMNYICHFLYACVSCLSVYLGVYGHVSVFVCVGQCFQCTWACVRMLSFCLSFWGIVELGGDNIFCWVSHFGG